jgi:hypothetical protein
MDRKVVIEDRAPFRIEVECSDDTDWDWSHYGKFCELPRSLNGQFDHSTQARNDPKGGDFYVRNPQAWMKRDTGNGTDSWVRVGAYNNYGWFKLAEHPRHEVEHLMTGGTPEREAWKVTLDRLDGLVEKLAAGDLTAVVISVTVYWNDEVVGDTVLGGIETDEYVDEAATVRLAEEHDLIDEALGYAKKKIEQACKTAMLANRPDGATNAG